METTLHFKHIPLSPGPLRVPLGHGLPGWHGPVQYSITETAELVIKATPPLPRTTVKDKREPILKPLSHLQHRAKIPLYWEK